MSTQGKSVAKIAHDILGLDTLATRNVDSLDFHEHAVWRIKEALNAAYMAGFQTKNRRHVESQASQQAQTENKE